MCYENLDLNVFVCLAYKFITIINGYNVLVVLF